MKSVIQYKAQFVNHKKIKVLITISDILWPVHAKLLLMYHSSFIAHQREMKVANESALNHVR